MVTNCPNCNMEARVYFSTKDWNRRISQDVFKYYKCHCCGLVFLNPLPENLAQYYPASYYSLPETLKDLSLIAEGERYKIDIIKQFVTKGRLLEIGPACGGFLHLARQEGYEVEAIEMDERCSKFLNEKVGIKVINSRDEYKALDVITPVNVFALWHVIEHLSDPWKMLEAAAKKILQGGILVIAAPNPNAFQFYLLGSFWAHVDAPRHLFLIPPMVLVRKMENLGMKLVLFTTNDNGSIGWNLFGWLVSLSNLSTHQFFKNFLGKIGTFICGVFGPIERRGYRGSAYTIVFQKE